MDLVKLILDQLSGDNLDRLSSQLGTSPKAAQAALSAAVPTILSSLAGLATNYDRSRQLSSILGSLDLAKLSNVAGLLGRERNIITLQGQCLMRLLFGDKLDSNIASAVGRYAGLDPGATKNLLSLVTPFILGKVACSWRIKGGTTGALQGLMADQQEYIADSLPSGFSPSNIPGLPSPNAPLRTVGQAWTAAFAASDWRLPSGPASD